MHICKKTNFYDVQLSLVLKGLANVCLMDNSVKGIKGVTVC